MDIDGLELPPEPRWAAWRVRGGAWWEEWYPVAAGVVLGAAAWWGTGPAEYGALLRDVGPTAVSVAAILGGFHSAAQSILLGMRGSRVVRALRESGHYDRLARYLGRGVMGLVACTVAGLAAMVARVWREPTGWWPGPAMGVLAGLFGYGLGASIRVLGLMVRIVRLDAQERPRGGS